MNKKSFSPAVLVLTVCFSIIFLCEGTFAGNHWLTGDRIMVEEGMALKAEPEAPRVFNIVISLYENPSGDNDPAYKEQSCDKNPETPDDRTPYEQIIGYFADAVYEATEGAHKIGRVSIYTNWDYWWKADIQWHEIGVVKTSLFLHHIQMSDRDIFDHIQGGDIGRKAGGYTLAHEWGHYKYKLFDEYAEGILGCLFSFNPCQLFDKEVEPSIMADQYFDGILSGPPKEYRALNFSIPWKEGGGPFRNTKKTAQHRMYGASCWEVLTRKPDNDPKFTQPGIVGRIKRKYFPELAAVAPENEPQIQLGEEGHCPRSKLEIIWMADKLVYQIVLDKSGSMGGENKMENAKKAAEMLVDKAEAGKDAVGVIAFNNSVSVVYPITDINNDSDKAPIISAINGISAGGGTLVGAAAQKALDDLLSQRDETESRVVFLLTDGQSGDNPRLVIPSYVANNIPLFTFAYGSNADQDLLREMADRTRGKFYFSPTTLAQITQAFNDAKREVSPAEGIKSGSFTLVPSLARAVIQTIDFPVDSTIDRFTVNVVYNGAVGDLVINLQDPLGNIYNVSECSASGSETLCLYTHEAPQAGIWQLVLDSQTSNPLNITYDIDGFSEDVISYSLSVTNLTGATVQYPTPILLLASFSKELPIAGAVISGTVEFPDGTIQQLDFRDDGASPDYMADDGNYTAVFTDYSMNGVYKINVSINNSNNTARMTSIYDLRSIITEATVETPPDIPIGEDVERVYSLQITIEGVVDDDHGDDFSTATDVTADNSDKPGKIEILGDIDFFRVNLPDPSAPEVVFRVTQLSPDMLPVLAVYDENGVLLQEEVYTSGDNYIFISIEPNGKNVFYASVRYRDNNDTGTYYFSAGSEIGSDIVACQCPEDGRRGCISGTVTRIDTGEPVAGKTVILKRIFPERPSVRTRVIADSNGCYQFADLEDGVYKIKVRRRRDCIVGRGERRKIVIIAGGMKVNDVDFECR